MIEVICWRWKPFKGFRTEFTACHVNTLYNMVKRNTTLPFKFTCITDDAEGILSEIRTIPLWDDCKDLKNPNNPKKPSCYRRLKAFSKDVPFENRIVSIDLDCVIVGNIDEILSRPEDFVCLQGTARKTPYNGGLWSLKVGSRPQVWDKFDPIQSPKLTRQAGIVGSDQGWISYILGKKEAVYDKSNGVYSFSEYFVRNGKTKLPDNAKIIMFQGGRDPWDKDVQKKYPWVNDHYKMDNDPIKPKIKPKHIDCITFLWGKEPYNYVYVNKLFNMIDRHLSYKHRNICFTNIPDGIREDVIIKPLRNEWMKHNLKKMIQYDPENGLKGRVLSFDLDMVILKSLDMYSEYTDEFCICEAVNPKRKGKCGGNFMAFNAGYGAETIWKPLNENYDYYAKETEGFERFLYDMLIKKMTFWPQDTIVSYKKHVRKNKVKDWDKVHMIWGHGRPQLTEIKDKIVVDNWK